MKKGDNNSTELKNHERPANALVFQHEGNTYVHTGFTKREVIAKDMAVALASNPEWAKTIRDDWDEFIERVTKGSIELADAFLAELEKTENDPTH